MISEIEMAEELVKTLLTRAIGRSYSRPRIVSRWGLVAFASSLDQIGPITNTVSDAAEILYSISGKDPLDSTCLDKPVPNYLTDLNKSINGLKIGIIKECFEHPGLNPEVKESVLSGVDRFQALGAEIIEVDLSLIHI